MFVDLHVSSCLFYMFGNYCTMLKVKRWFFLIGYWLVHIGGVFPVKLKSSKKTVPSVSSEGERTPWTPWISTRRGILIGILQISLILYNFTGWFAWHFDDLGDATWNYEYFEKLTPKSIGLMTKAMTFFFVLTATIRHREIEQLLNNVCIMYFDVFKSSDPPKARKFVCLITYAIFSNVVTTAIHVSTDVSMPGFLQKFLRQATHMNAMTYVEATSGIILIYLQSAMEELNREIKTRFPRVDEFDPKNWEPVIFRGDNHRRKRTKYFVAECRRRYRSAAKIADQLNSVYGFPKTIIVIFNQTSCLASAFCYLVLLTKSMSNFEPVDHQEMILFGFSSVWSFLRTSMICHTHEIVLKEVQVTIRYMATLDASEIDEDSKIELLEFLEEIDGRGIRFTASNIFSLDYATCYLLLTSTITYITIVIQQLASWDK